MPTDYNDPNDPNDPARGLSPRQTRSGFPRVNAPGLGATPRSLPLTGAAPAPSSTPPLRAAPSLADVQAAHEKVLGLQGAWYLPTPSDRKPALQAAEQAENDLLGAYQKTQGTAASPDSGYSPELRPAPAGYATAPPAPPRPSTAFGPSALRAFGSAQSAPSVADNSAPEQSSDKQAPQPGQDGVITRSGNAYSGNNIGANPTWADADGRARSPGGGFASIPGDSGGAAYGAPPGLRDVAQLRAPEITNPQDDWTTQNALRNARVSADNSHFLLRSGRVRGAGTRYIPVTTPEDRHYEAVQQTATNYFGQKGALAGAALTANAGLLGHGMDSQTQLAVAGINANALRNRAMLDMQMKMLPMQRMQGYMQAGGGDLHGAYQAALAGGDAENAKALQEQIGAQQSQTVERQKASHDAMEGFRSQLGAMYQTPDGKPDPAQVSRGVGLLNGFLADAYKGYMSQGRADEAQRIRQLGAAALSQSDMDSVHKAMEVIDRGIQYGRGPWRSATISDVMHMQKRPGWFTDYAVTGDGAEVRIPALAAEEPGLLREILPQLVGGSATSRKRLAFTNVPYEQPR